MADARPFRGLRFNTALADPAFAIAPPYDVISPDEQQALYRRSAYNIVRVEYGEQHDRDTPADNRYTRAARDVAEWRRAGVLTRDVPSVYAYRQEFTWQGRAHVRRHYVAAVRLEPWDAGIIKPHERTLSGPKADRLDLLRSTRTQVSPVYCLYRSKAAVVLPELEGEPLYDFAADGQRHVLTAISEPRNVATLAAHLAECEVYIADGHHRYETALAYRDERRAQAPSWTGEEPENFVLMALTAADDPGLLVLPTHRLLALDPPPPDAVDRIAPNFRIDELGPSADAAALDSALGRLAAATGDETAFVAVGFGAGRLALLTLAKRAAVEALMPDGQPDAWKHLDVSVLQYGILRQAYGIDDAAMAAGGAVSYTQDPGIACDAVAKGRAGVAFLLNATRVEQVLAVADAGGRMPQKSTYFYPKLPTGLVMNALDADD